MNTKSSEIFKYFPHIVHLAGIAAWGIAVFLILSPSSTWAKEPPRHRQNVLVLLRPSDLLDDVNTAGNDMYLYEGNAKTYLYVEQEDGKHLLILDVTDPQRAFKAAELSMSVDAPYEFLDALGGGTVLVRFHTKEGEASEWGRLRLKRPATPTLSTWIQSSGDIVDPLNNRIVDTRSSLFLNQELPRPYQIIDASNGEEHCLATIPGVKKTLTDTDQGRTFYLASDGVWILRNLSVEKKHQIETAQLK